MRICIISTPVIPSKPDRIFSGYGGLERVCGQLSESLAAAGHQVTLIGAEGSVAEGCRVLTVPIGTPENQMVDIHKDAFIEQDVVQDESWQHWAVPYWMENPALARKVKLQILHHGVLGDIQKRPPLQHPNWTCFSKAQAAMIASALGIVTKYVYHGVDTNVFTRAFSHDGYILMLTRLSPEKGVLQAVRLLKELHLPAVVIADDKLIADRNYAKQVLAECNGEVRFVSGTAIPLDQQLEWMAHARAMLHTPLYPWTEIFGLAVVQMQAMGKPVIATSNGALPETVEHGVTGFLAGSVDELAPYFDRLDEISPDACRERVLKYFSVPVMTQSHIRLMEELVAGREW